MTTFFTAPDAAHPALMRLRHAGFDGHRIDQVLALYDEPHRRYHDREHIGEMLDAALAFEIPLASEQALALLFHDAVYVPGAARGGNEAMSAQLLRVYSHGMPAQCVDQACAIVLDTADHVARSVQAEIVLDLDLMRLAAPPASFERFAQAIFAEQRALIPADDDEAWRLFDARRLPFYERLLARPAIYAHRVCRRRLESAARANLGAALGRADAGLRESDIRETA